MTEKLSRRRPRGASDAEDADDDGALAWGLPIARPSRRGGSVRGTRLPVRTTRVMAVQRRLVPLVALATFAGWAAGELRFSRALGSHMVLQQAPARANIWGFDAPAGAEVIITLRAMDGGSGRLVGTVNATADQNGNFATLLPPQSPGPRSSPTAHTIRAAVPGGNTVAAEMVDVLFGELWMCGGSVRLLISFVFRAVILDGCPDAHACLDGV
jgi:hypothetical protein